MRKFLSLSLLLLFASGCAMIPKYERPQAPVPAQLPGTGTGLEGAQNPAELPWREFAQNDKLSKLIELALEHNRDLRLAALNADPANPLPGLDPNLPVHPTFLYEFLANMLIFVILIFVLKKQKRPWTTVLTYFFLYGIVRFFVEGIRTDALMFTAFGQTWRISQVLSAAMVAGSILLYIFIGIYEKRRQRLIASLAPGAATVTRIERITGTRD